MCRFRKAQDMKATIEITCRDIAGFTILSFPSSRFTAITAFSISISYLFIYANVGKGLPTYCVTRTVGRQPFAANDFKT